MPVPKSLLALHLPGFPAPLLEEMGHHGDLVSVPAHTGLMRQGQYVKTVPVVISGLLKV